VRRSNDFGLTWTTVDDYQYPNNLSARASDIVIAGATIIVIGIGISNTGGTHWITRKSTDADITVYNSKLYGIGLDTGAGLGTIFSSVDQGSNWSTVDSYLYASQRITSDSINNIFVSGVYYDGTSIMSCAVRGSKDGTHWATLDLYNDLNSTSCNATFITTDASSNVYLTVSTTGGTGNRWVLRQALAQ
jgi:hypothetical protein